MGRRCGCTCCGPTVYNFAHIGNLRTYIFEDLLHRTLQMHGWAVDHVMNITDVGHMTSDSDSGEDKMATAAEREKQSPWELAKKYEAAFFARLGKAQHYPGPMSPPAPPSISPR